MLRVTLPSRPQLWAQAWIQPPFGRLRQGRAEDGRAEAASGSGDAMFRFREIVLWREREWRDVHTFPFVGLRAAANRRAILHCMPDQAPIHTYFNPGNAEVFLIGYYSTFE
jgi:hypothetical protein